MIRVKKERDSILMMVLENLEEVSN